MTRTADHGRQAQRTEGKRRERANGGERTLHHKLRLTLSRQARTLPLAKRWDGLICPTKHNLLRQNKNLVGQEIGLLGQDKIIVGQKDSLLDKLCWTNLGKVVTECLLLDKKTVCPTKHSLLDTLFVVQILLDKTVPDTLT